MVESLRRRVALMIGRCVIAAANAGGGRVTVAIRALDGEESVVCEWAEPTGLTSPPLPGAEGVTLSVVSERGQRVILALGDRRHRPQDLKPGEVAIFDQRGGGNQVRIEEGKIRIVAPQKLEIETPLATINGDAIACVGDRVNVGAGSSAGLWELVEGVGVGP